MSTGGRCSQHSPPVPVKTPPLPLLYWNVRAGRHGAARLAARTRQAAAARSTQVGRFQVQGAQVNTSNLKRGVKLEIEGAPYVVTEFQFVKPGKGQGLYRCKLKNMLDGATLDRTFRSDEEVNDADVSESEMQYLYSQNREYWFMDTATYDQMFLNEAQLGDARNFLQENALVTVMFHNGLPVGVTPPNFVEFEVTSAEASIKGAMKREAPSPPPSRPGTPSPSPCSWSRATSSASTLAPAPTSNACASRPPPGIPGGRS